MSDERARDSNLGRGAPGNDARWSAPALRGGGAALAPPYRALPLEYDATGFPIPQPLPPLTERLRRLRAAE